MEAHLEQIREQQKESWNKFSQGWRKWDELTMGFLKPYGDEIIRLLRPAGNDVVLDVAAGTGEPGLTIASMLQGGRVVSIDLSEGMLEVARENAAKRGITNFETIVGDVSELPFEDNTFDAISCRFGYMFFPDMFLATREMVRVLKPGGRIATSVWDVPEKNFWVTAIMGTIKRNIELPPPVPEAPGMFRCSENGLIAHLFRQAGLTNIVETEVTGNLNAGTVDVYWNMMTEVGAPIVAALSNADDLLKDKIKAEVFETVNQKYPDGNVAFDTGSLIYYGEKS
jgi:ubiquinone/menaquinone biosynthesis C-methylase UbiE